jgi:hypothetical protein
MGRYYSGDIEGVFWFGLQSSYAASRFGGQGVCLSCSFYEEDDLESIEAEIKAIEDKLGDKINIIANFFETNNGYNDEMIKPFFTEGELSDYADLLLGRQIRDHVKEFGECHFDAEL